MLTYLKHMALAAAAALCAAPAAQAADQPQEWELINPTGEIEKVVRCFGGKDILQTISAQ